VKAASWYGNTINDMTMNIYGFVEAIQTAHDTFIKNFENRDEQRLRLTAECLKLRRVPLATANGQSVAGVKSHMAFCSSRIASPAGSERDQQDPNVITPAAFDADRLYAKCTTLRRYHADVVSSSSRKPVFVTLRDGVYATYDKFISAMKVSGEFLLTCIDKVDELIKDDGSLRSKLFWGTLKVSKDVLFAITIFYLFKRLMRWLSPTPVIEQSMGRAFGQKVGTAYKVLPPTLHSHMGQQGTHLIQNALRAEIVNVTKDFLVNLTLVKGRQALSVRHFWDYTEPNDELHLHLSTGVVFAFRASNCQVNNFTYMASEETSAGSMEDDAGNRITCVKDLCVVKFPVSVASWRDNTHMFIKNDDLKLLTNGWAMLPKYTRQQKETASGAFTLTSHLATDMRGDGGNYYYSATCFRYRIQCSVGDCGCPMIVGNNVERPIAGVHFAGADRDSDVGYAHIVTQEMLATMLQEDVTPPTLTHVKSHSAGITIPKGNFTIHGEIDRPPIA
jgi:hypothetical protein